MRFGQMRAWPVRIHCETGSLSARLAFEMRAKCQDFMARCKYDGIPDEIDSPFWQRRTNITVGQRKSLEDREILETICAPVESLALKARSSLPWRRWHRYIHCPCAWRPSTSSQHQGTKQQCGKPSVQTCFLWKRTVVCSDCSWFACSWYSWWSVATGHLSSQKGNLDGRPFASPLFRRLAGRGPFFRGFPFRWALQLTVSLARCLTYTMSCLSFIALWPHRSQSAMLQEIQPAKDICLICCKTLPTKSVTCSQVGPCPLSGRRVYLQDPTNPALHLPMKIYSTNNEGTLSVEYTFIQNRFHPLTLSSKHDFIQWHFHPKTVSSNDTFIQNTFIQFWHFHPMTLSSNTLSSNNNFIQWISHPMTFSSNDIFNQ